MPKETLKEKVEKSKTFEDLFGCLTDETITDCSLDEWRQINSKQTVDLVRRFITGSEVDYEAVSCRLNSLLSKHAECNDNNKLKLCIIFIVSSLKALGNQAKLFILWKELFIDNNTTPVWMKIELIWRLLDFELTNRPPTESQEDESQTIFQNFIEENFFEFTVSLQKWLVSEQDPFSALKNRIDDIAVNEHKKWIYLYAAYSLSQKHFGAAKSFLYHFAFSELEFSETGIQEKFKNTALNLLGKLG